LSRVVVTLIALAVAAPAIAQQQAPQQAPQQVEDRFASELGVQGGLTADEVAQRAAATSTDVQASLARLQASQAASTRARWSWLPSLALSARYTRLSKLADQGNPFASLQTPLTIYGTALGRANLLTPAEAAQLQAANASSGGTQFGAFNVLDQYSLDANLAVPLSDYVLRIPRLVEAAGNNERAAELSNQASKAAVASQARSAYWSWVGARLSRLVAQQTLEQAQSYLKDVEAATRAGVTSNADLLQAQAQTAQAELGLASAQAGAQIAEQQLATALHDPPGREYTIGETLSAEVSAPAEPMDALLAEALRSRLEVQSLTQAISSLQETAGATRVQAWPALSGFAGATYAQPNQRYFLDPNTWHGTWQVGAQVTWVPTAMPQVLASADEIEAQSRQLEAQRAQLQDGIRLEISAAQNALARARVAESSTQKQLAAAEEAYRVRRLLFQNGRATGTEVTQALSDLAGARLGALSAQIDLRTAAVRLQHAVGRDVSRGS
jgi:outer membrane protein